MNIITVTVAGSLMAMLTPAIAQMALQPILTVKRANNFSIAESSAVTYAAISEANNELGPAPPGCSVLPESENSYTITCKEGSGEFLQKVSRSFRLEMAGYNSLGVNSDDDRDGFDDVTGMPTHYWECYSGWKGQGTLKNNCALGGKYVIPAYARLYGIESTASQSNDLGYTPGVYCPPWDTDGSISFNDAHNVRCIPTDGTVDNGNMN